MYNQQAIHLSNQKTTGVGDQNAQHISYASLWVADNFQNENALTDKEDGFQGGNTL